ncbi:hypothetical protein VOLCADRAFT_55720 [Volvox carteri f. nagariensis]|uniref:Uncharacterized protein n=1 Tax=Volvox carteri f. nagariensis TaxID=3068 RepID=D8TJT5_VOLCA|nr:uncharacterized protein VOLCADRAFT_55720 [Volvox carteri f. nagariensis]EFJ52426.1 hypothetical protein VOLCADRAFT_55720 [Volvox carteri f. nagariensis]|eukprot:XP_002946499.1 hypothetical protein VOLCADRAFT_55720 [Volvox carteri f. nagariensis]
MCPPYNPYTANPKPCTSESPGPSTPLTPKTQSSSDKEASVANSSPLHTSVGVASTGLNTSPSVTPPASAAATAAPPVPRLADWHNVPKFCHAHMHMNRQVMIISVAYHEVFIFGLLHAGV